ncbi:hypothetical protein [Aestuariispira insulae]|uniref:Uncharacterized protein n=1 Tax=Aestuariispira insulae TaxID=1461337 RepID=A0A3D9HRB7_9PROT|nr:hypothetical protein [Aestuariispira insulae]RED52032.1 hypothetical protein DFP90_10248 [Aestuariispira insulae]
MIFANSNRSDLGPKKLTETEFEYLDRSGTEAAQRVRDFLETWIKEFPEDESNEIRARIQSGEQSDFSSASFEIFLFSVFKQAGCKVIHHPELENGSNKHPDFLVTLPDGEEVYVEAVLASDLTAEEIAAQKRKNVVLEALENDKIPDFFLLISSNGSSNTSPPSKKLREKVQNWINKLDPDELLKANHTQISDFPQLTWTHEDWSLTITALPKSPEKRGNSVRNVGSYSDGARWVNIREPLRNAIKDKGKNMVNWKSLWSLL